MTARRFITLAAVSGVLALMIRSSETAVVALDQNRLTADLCQLVSLPLETGLVRETYERLEQGLKLRGEKGACVSVTDNGRSFSPDCLAGGVDYRTVVCKATANTGMRAAVSFQSDKILSTRLFWAWLVFFVGILLLLLMIELAAWRLIRAFSLEVRRLINGGAPGSSTSQKLVQLILRRLGIAETLGAEAGLLHREIRQNQVSAEREAAKLARAEQGVDQCQDSFRKGKPSSSRHPLPTQLVTSYSRTARIKRCRSCKGPIDRDKADSNLGQ